jgi:hypothetical protein
MMMFKSLPVTCALFLAAVLPVYAQNPTAQTVTVKGCYIGGGNCPLLRASDGKEYHFFADGPPVPPRHQVITASGRVDTPMLRGFCISTPRFFATEIQVSKQKCRK